MSGGHFDYAQFHIQQIAEQLNDDIELLENPDPDDDGFKFSEKTLGEFRNGLLFLKLAGVYAQRIDWLMSCDDGEETFHKRLKDDLEGLI